MRDLFFTLVLLAAIPIGLTTNYMALAFWYWIAFFQPHTQSFSFAMSVPFGQVAAGLALLSWMISKEKKLPPATPIVVLLVLLAVWVSITSLAAMFPSYAYVKWDLTVKVILMALVGIAVMQSRERLNILIWAICLAIGYYGFKLGLFGLAGGGGSSYRGPSYMNENNGLARAMIMFIPLLWYLVLQHKQTWVRAGLIAVGLSSCLALLFSGSRGAWIAALAMAGFYGLRIKGGVFWMSIAGVLAVATIPLLPDHIVARFTSIGELGTDGSFQGRVEAWKFGFNLFLDRPIVGGGFGVFDYGHGRASHNSYFQMLGEHGGVGFILFISLLWYCASAMRWVRRMTKERPDLKWASQLALMLQVILVGYCVGSLTINHAVFPLLYGIISIIAALQIVVRRELAASAAAAAPEMPADPSIGYVPSRGTGTAR